MEYQTIKLKTHYLITSEEINIQPHLKEFILKHHSQMYE
jgi:hypothetical protein